MVPGACSISVLKSLLERERYLPLRKLSTIFQSVVPAPPATPSVATHVRDRQCRACSRIPAIVAFRLRFARSSFAPVLRGRASLPRLRPSSPHRPPGPTLDATTRPAFPSLQADPRQPALPGTEPQRPLAMHARRVRTNRNRSTSTT